LSVGGGGTKGNHDHEILCDLHIFFFLRGARTEEKSDKTQSVSSRSKLKNASSPVTHCKSKRKMVLSQEEIDGCREAFLAFDKDRSGTIDVWELRQVLEAMGQKPTEEELFQMISEVDENMSGSIDFAEFLKVIENQKERAENFDDESDMIDAFVACGGLQNKSGHVKRETLVRIIKHDFGLTIDIEELINKIDTDGSGEIEFEEFKTLLS
jgi:Ca2+-binding EF-hand superfamily protein